MTRHFLEQHFARATFLDTKFRVMVGIRVGVRVRIMVCGWNIGIVVTAIVGLLPGIAIPGIVRELCSRRLSSKIIFVSFYGNFDISEVNFV